MKQLEHLLFLQGNKCFFCGHRIADGQASVEHLHALSNGGKKTIENSVACCKAANGALGNLPLKEKIRVMLSHKGASECPALTMSIPKAKAPETTATKASETTATKARKLLPEAVKNLQKRGKSRPTNSSKLRKSLATTFKQASRDVIDAVMVLLKDKSYTAEDGGKLSYPRFKSGA